MAQEGPQTRYSGLQEIAHFENKKSTKRYSH